MFNPFFVGVLGSLVLLLGAAWPAKKIKIPRKSFKNWCFLIGSLVMFIYSYLNYISGGSVFYVLLQLLTNSSSLFLIFNLNRSISKKLVYLISASLIFTSFYLMETYDTLYFIIGLTFIAIGYVTLSGTFKRNLYLFVGSVLISVFSYFEGNAVFFWLNVFFAVFALYHMIKLKYETNRNS